MISFHPKRGSLLMVTYEPGFKLPEMVKRRLAVVVSPPMSRRGDLVTVVALSTTPPNPSLLHHCEIDIPFALPPQWQTRCWVKGDMVNAVGFHRCDLVQLGKAQNGERVYQLTPLPPAIMDVIERCVKSAMGLKS